jgi:hypothetical protein
MLTMMWDQNDGVLMLDGERAGELIAWPADLDRYKVPVRWPASLSVGGEGNEPRPDDLLVQTYELDRIFCVTHMGRVVVPVGRVGPRELNDHWAVALWLAVGGLAWLWWGRWG